jgi:hypothetical protein
MISDRRLKWWKKTVPWDCALMEFMTSAYRSNPSMLIVGEDYLDQVLRHAYYFTAKLGMKCAYLCLESDPVRNVRSMLSLATGISHKVLASDKVPRCYFPDLNDGAQELYHCDCQFYDAPLDIGRFVSLAKHLKTEHTEVIVIDALHQIEFEPGKLSSPSHHRSYPRRFVQSLMQAS